MCIRDSYQPEEAEYIQIPDQTEYTITESGLYQLPDAQSAQYMHITIDPAATEVTLKGNPDVTYQDLKVHCPGTVQMCIRDRNFVLPSDVEAPLHFGFLQPQRVRGV